MRADEKTLTSARPKRLRTIQYNGNTLGHLHRLPFQQSLCNGHAQKLGDDGVLPAALFWYDQRYAGNPEILTQFDDAPEGGPNLIRVSFGYVSVDGCHWIVLPEEINALCSFKPVK